ncbi:MAG: IS110 family transposase [Nitrospiraceae bacterium]|nr:MAG: IS110 family transposase [Nitrospiraceae bacterium]
MSNLFIGIDVSKDFSTVQGLDNSGDKQFYLEISMDAEGFSTLLKKIREVSNDMSKVLVAMESTGCYNINLFSFLSSQGISCFIVNPLLISNDAKLSLRKTKTDKKDALTIAQFLLANKDSLRKNYYSQNMQDVRDLSRERESLTGLISAMKNDIKRLLQITFPEVHSVCNRIFTETMLNFLRQFPSARMIQSADPTDIEKALIHGKRVLYSAEDIINAAEKSVASESDAKELILSEKASTVLYLQEKREKITELLIESCKAMRIDDLTIMKSIGGVSDITGSTFLAELGDIKNFSSHKHLIAFAGLDPAVYQSGQYAGKGKISKRGNKHLRRVIFLMTMCVIRSNHVFQEYFQRRKNDGLVPIKALFATSHKLIRVIFAMLTKKILFRKEVVDV